MNPATIVTVLQMLLAAEPAAVQVVHDFLVGTGGKSDQATLTQDLADWQGILDKANAQLAGGNTAPAPTPIPGTPAAS